MYVNTETGYVKKENEGWKYVKIVLINLLSVFVLSAAINFIGLGLGVYRYMLTQHGLYSIPVYVDVILWSTFAGCGFGVLWLIYGRVFFKKK